MGKIYYILGKSSSGKDTIYKRLLNSNLKLNNIVMYTTRPKRDGEIDKVTYNYVNEKEYLDIKNKGLLIEERSYDTVYGIWRYFTVKDEQIDLTKNNYLIIGVLDSFVSTKEYFGEDIVVPIYIEVEDGERLRRALKREMKPQNHKYAEMCRRFLSDTEDFAEEKLIKAGITRRFINEDLDDCIAEVKSFITDDVKNHGAITTV